MLLLEQLVPIWDREDAANEVKQLAPVWSSKHRHGMVKHTERESECDLTRTSDTVHGEAGEIHRMR